MITIINGDVLQAVLAAPPATTQPQAVVSFSNKTAAGYSPGRQLTVLTGVTDVAILATPAVGSINDVDLINILNRDTAAVTLTVKIDVAGVDSPLITVMLQTLETLTYTHSDGWEVMTATGGTKTPGGTVTSVGLIATPASVFDVSNSPIQTSGNIILSLDNQSANQVLAGPTGGAATTPAFRSLVAADMPGQVQERDLLINPGFWIDQQGMAAGATVNDDAYCLDCWYALTQTASISISQQATQANGVPRNIRLTQTQAASQRMGLAQIIEARNCVERQLEPVTFTFRVRTSASQPIRYAILAWTSTEDVATSDVVNDWTSAVYTPGNFFITPFLLVVGIGSFTPAPGGFIDNVSLTGTIPAGTSNLIAFVWTENVVPQNFTLDLARMFLEDGSVATTYHDPDFQTEIVKAQRYFRVIGGSIGPRYVQARTTGVNSSEFILNLQPPMRIAPAVTVNNPTSWSVNDGSVQVAWISIAGAVGFTDMVNVNINNGAVVAFRPAFITPNNANGTIYLDARL